MMYLRRLVSSTVVGCVATMLVGCIAPTDEDVLDDDTVEDEDVATSEEASIEDAQGQQANITADGQTLTFRFPNIGEGEPHRMLQVAMRGDLGSRYEYADILFEPGTTNATFASRLFELDGQECSSQWTVGYVPVPGRLTRDNNLVVDVRLPAAVNPYCGTNQVWVTLDQPTYGSSPMDLPDGYHRTWITKTIPHAGANMNFSFDNLPASADFGVVNVGISGDINGSSEKARVTVPSWGTLTTHDSGPALKQCGGKLQYRSLDLPPHNGQVSIDVDLSSSVGTFCEDNRVMVELIYRER